MKRIKLDENFPPAAVEIFRKVNIDASSVLEQHLTGASDDHLYKLCIEETRVMVTFDLDFANIIRFPSSGTPGIVVCRLRKNISLSEVIALCQTLAGLIISNDLEEKLYIVEQNKIRIRKPLQ